MEKVSTLEEIHIQTCTMTFIIKIEENSESFNKYIINKQPIHEYIINFITKLKQSQIKQEMSLKDFINETINKLDINIQKIYDFDDAFNKFIELNPHIKNINIFLKYDNNTLHDICVEKDEKKL